MAAPDTGGLNAPPADPPQLASAGQLASLNQAALQSGSTGKAGQGSGKCPVKKSWFSLAVVQSIEGAEQAVEGLTLTCKVPDLGESNRVTSSGSPDIRIGDLTPGGTGDVLGTSHDDLVWEVVADIS